MDKRRKRLRALLKWRHSVLVTALLSTQLTNRRMWVRPIFERRESFGEYNLVEEMRNDPECFHKYCRMNAATFDVLLTKVAPLITKMTTNWRLPVSAEQRLAITLRYLATGDSKQTISFSFRVGYSTVSKIIEETCNALWTVLQPEYLRMPSSQSEWHAISKEFYESWNFPMCIGSIDGKHIMIQAPPNAGSEYFNYKGHHSIVLLAVCDASYRFTAVDIGDSGRHSDGGVFSNSQFGKDFLNDDLNFPEPDLLTGTNNYVPYCLVGDAAFPLKNNLMRPYPGKSLPHKKVVFNYRLSRARRVIENAFGILSSRWRIFRRSINAAPEKVISATKAACCLHNFLMTLSKDLPVQKRNYCPPTYVDREDGHGNYFPGEWRYEMSEQPLAFGRSGANSYAQSAASIRDIFADYFLSEEGKLSWQDAVVNRL